MDDVRAWFSQPFTGTVETAASPFWRLVRDVCPEARTVVVRRPVAEVVDSLARMGMTFDRSIVEKTIAAFDRKLDQIEARVPGVLSVTFDDLAREETCSAVLEHCLDVPHNPEWWRMMAPINLQTSMAATIRYFQAYEPQLTKLAKVVKHFTVANMSRRVKADLDGVTIQEEAFETFYRDGQSLFADHLIEVGEAPDNFINKNIPLMASLADMGAIRVFTARSNGRMFGYLMTLIAPSLEYRDRTTAIHTAVYASKLVPGLGMRMQRHAEAELRASGIDELFFRAGIRGDGPRMSRMYQRLGAEDFGHLFRLDLKEAA